MSNNTLPRAAQRRFFHSIMKEGEPRTNVDRVISGVKQVYKESKLGTQSSTIAQRTGPLLNEKELTGGAVAFVTEHRVSENQTLLKPMFVRIRRNFMAHRWPKHSSLALIEGTTKENDSIDLANYLLDEYEQILTKAPNSKSSIELQQQLEFLEKMLEDETTLSSSQRQRWHELWRRSTQPVYEQLYQHYHELVDREIVGKLNGDDRDRISKVRASIDDLDEKDPLFRDSQQRYDRLQSAIKNVEVLVRDITS